jgi:hypothetical protein
LWQIEKEEVDYALRFKRRAKSDFNTYPPRIILIVLHQLNAEVEGTLDCQIGVSGIKGVPYFELHVLPPVPLSVSEVSSQRSIEGITNSVNLNKF